MRNVDLSDAHIWYATLEQADLSGANLLNTLGDNDPLAPGLNSLRLAGARWTLDTEWPPEVYTTIRSRSIPVGHGAFVVATSHVYDPAPEPQPVP
ncbi:pentapeptide repeat-containing protein [Streptomyces sp. NBC_01236]|uniref:pentapeptide repeat-containing protein n=1 Tax=Streptomyces sp. NBC_01236 TaxID=2903789 RepID=UPI003FA39C34